MPAASSDPDPLARPHTDQPCDTIEGGHYLTHHDFSGIELARPYGGHCSGPHKAGRPLAGTAGLLCRSIEFGRQRTLMEASMVDRMFRRDPYELSSRVLSPSRTTIRKVPRASADARNVNVAR